VSRTRKSDHPYAIKALRRLDPNLLTFLAVLSAVPVRAHDLAKPASRAEATSIIANARKIMTSRSVFVPNHLTTLICSRSDTSVTFADTFPA
jgi:hypothetical protein